MRRTSCSSGSASCSRESSDSSVTGVTVVGSSTRTLAVRGPAPINAISPISSPGPTVAMTTSLPSTCLKTSARPCSMK